MSDIAIRVEHLSKRYRLGERQPYKSLREAISNAARAPLGWLPGKRAAAAGNGPGYFWALDDISFEIKQGEAVGIIGRNGAGKSTLLKILSRITKPTRGRAEIYGRVGSLLEVGTGFHPELTGRENIFLNGAILGMKRSEIQRKFDEIVAFAEVEEFLNTPVKHYSSGMYVRLAFAVAAHLEPEILLVDEVLAVGDAQFQKKCLGKMGEVASQGRTVLFVSHNMAAIQNLCTKSIWVDAGSIKKIGETQETIHSYLFQSNAFDYTGYMDLRDWPNRYGNGEAKILSARLVDEKSRLTTIAYRTQSITVEFELECRSSNVLNLSAVIVSDTGVKVLHLSNLDSPEITIGSLQGKYLVKFEIPNLPLCAGNYTFVLAIHTDNLIPLDVVRDVLPFTAEDIINSPRPYKTVNEYAYCWVPNRWSIAPITK